MQRDKQQARQKKSKSKKVEKVARALQLGCKVEVLQGAFKGLQGGCVALLEGCKAIIALEGNPIAGSMHKLESSRVRIIAE